MSRNDLQVLKEGDWFLGYDGEQTDYDIRYSYVICRALLHYLQTRGYDHDTGKTVLNDLKRNFEDKAHFRVGNGSGEFLELLPLSDNMGFVVVDHSAGMYPQVLYGSDVKRDGKPRDAAFELQLKEVIDNYDDVHSFLKGHTTERWTQEFQEELFKKAKFKNLKNLQPQQENVGAC